MADSLCERALKEVTRRCGLILIASGYNTNLGQGVVRAKRSVDVKTCPVAVVWDQGDTPERADKTVGAFTVDQAISVEIHVKPNQDTTGILISAYKADVKKAVMTGIFTDATGELGALSYLGAVASPRDDGSVTESMTINFSVKLKEAYGNPNSSQPLNVNP